MVCILAVFLKSIYKLRTKKIFKKDEDFVDTDEDVFQINHISLCPESRTLAVANGASTVAVYKLVTQETVSEIQVSHKKNFLSFLKNKIVIF